MSSAEIIAVHAGGNACYHITIAKDYQELPDALESLQMARRRVFVVSETNVAPLHAEGLLEALKPLCGETHLYVFPAGEEQKRLETVTDLVRFLDRHMADRGDILVSLGGGVCSDLTGFAAAVYLRGIRVVHIPTSLLAMADASVGGKTGVNFDCVKNRIGAFHQPSAVYMNLSLLDTIGDREYRSGFAEMIKHGLLGDRELYRKLREDAARLLARDYNSLAGVMKSNCRVKERIVEEDPRDEGVRALLNLGHTVGHALEEAEGFGLLHGECVAAGCAAAAYLSMRRGYISSEDYREIRDTFEAFGLPTVIPGLPKEEILQLSKKDKKMVGGILHFVVLAEIGRAEIRQDVTEDELRSAIDSIAVE
ncbi:MAG: 3-dehydroquinate synthase [Lachnospiraceae bacterium]|nr:3-dehydroquinate synthase [Lachnospiraceae bacterium]